MLVLTTGTEVRGELPFLPFFIGIKGKSHRSPDRNRSTSIHILDDDTLFRVFSYCRLTAFDHCEFDDICASQWCVWEGGCWWHKLVKVCRRWRCLILGSAFHLGVRDGRTLGSELCTFGLTTPARSLYIDIDCFRIFPLCLFLSSLLSVLSNCQTSPRDEQRHIPF